MSLSPWFSRHRNEAVGQSSSVYVGIDNRNDPPFREGGILKKATLGGIIGGTGNWLPQSVATIQTFKSIGIMDCSSILSFPSPTSFRRAFCGFPCDNITFFMDIRNKT